MGLTVYFGPPKTFAPVRSASRNENSATERQIRRSIRSVRKAASSSPSPSRHSFAPYASPTAIRTTEMGACTPPSGGTPGIRRPVRTITRPPISSRRMRFGEPTSSAPSGVIVAAFSPRPASRTAAAASCTISLGVARREASERSKRGNRSSTPVTSGASTRSASSSNSCPVSSPSSTTIVFPAIRPQLLPGLGLRPRGYIELYGSPRRVEAAGLAGTVSVRRLSRPQDRGRTSARADRRAAHPAGLARRLDLAPSGREAAGDRAGQRRPAPVPLPPGVPRRAGAGEVRQVDQLRREAAGPAHGDGDAHRAGAAELRVDGGAGGAPDQRRLVPRRRRALREEVPDVRDHDPAQGARARAREQDRLSVSRKASRQGAHGARRYRARGRDARAARPEGRPPALALSERRWLCQPDRPQAERLHPRAHGRGFHRQGFPNLGRNAARGDRARRAQPGGDANGAEADDRGGHALRRRTPGKFGRGSALVVRQPRGRRAVSRRANDR